MSTRFRGLIATFGIATVLIGGAVAGVSAQSSPPSMNAAIVQGGCDSLSDVALHNLTAVTNNNPRVGGSFSGSANAFAVLTSESDARIRLSDLLGSQHSIVIGDLAAPLACGEIGGITSRISGDFRIGIAAIGDSGVFGIAELESDDDETEIDLYVAAPFRP
jgi:hypothetical protein